MEKKKVLVILGQTATGKSALAVRVAKKINGEIISADSRQVYRGLDLGTGKITKKEMKGVPHHLLDVVSLKKKFTVADYKRLADKKVKEIIKRGKTPIICGGTGFYIDSLVDGTILPQVPPNAKLRKILDKKSATELIQELQKIDPKRAQNIDPYNKVRLIRAIEIAKYLGKVPEIRTTPPQYEFIKVGLKLPEKLLKRRIEARLRKRVRAGMAIEIYELQKKKVPWSRFLELGFDQKFITLYLQKKIGEKEMLESLYKGNWQYAKRQMTWFKRDKRVKWFDARGYGAIEKYIKDKLK